MKKLAWVCGSKATGYEIVVTLLPSTEDYQCLNHKRFTKFRAAQNIANAINSACAKKKTVTGATTDSR